MDCQALLSRMASHPASLCNHSTRSCDFFQAQAFTKPETIIFGSRNHCPQGQDINLPSRRADERKQGVKTHEPAVPQQKSSQLHASSAPQTQRCLTGPSHQYNQVFFLATKQEYSINSPRNNPQICHGTAIIQRPGRANPACQ